VSFNVSGDTCSYVILHWHSREAAFAVRLIKSKNHVIYFFTWSSAAWFACRCVNGKVT